MSEWKTSPLGKLVDIRVSNVDKKIYQHKALVSLCNYMDVYSNDYITNNISFQIGSADKNEIQRFGLKCNDVIITKDSETPDDIAISAVVKEDLRNVVCGYHLAILRPNIDELSGTFLMQKIKLPELKRYFFSVANGSTRYGLTIGDIEKARISYPTSLSEQRKIARILSTVDAVIEKTEAAIAKYKAIKQGMMADLFTRGIDLATGKLRPRYEDAPEMYKPTELGWVPKEWEVKMVNEVSENLDGKRRPIKESDRSLMQGTIPYYGASGIIDYVNDFIFDESLILLGEDGENVVSRNLPLAFIINGKTWVNNHAHVLKPASDIDIVYLTEYLEHLDYSDIVSGSAQPKITQNTLNKKLVKKPSFGEQIIISKRMGSINRSILKELIIKSKYHQLKQSLMSDLLTGKVRVKYEEEQTEAA